MSVSACWRCLSRLSLQPPFRPTTSPRAATLLPTSSSQPFSTTTPLPAAAESNKRGVRRNAVPKGARKKRTKNYKRPDPGERKALRKRIVLSNTNALEVGGLEEYTPQTAGEQSNVGKVLALKGDSVDGLRAAEAFKVSQRWGYFRRPCTLATEQTVELNRAMQEAVEGEKKETVRRMIVGDRGAGKSILLLQAQAWALAKGWVVMHFPEARDLTSATTHYAPLPKSQPPLYTQKDYTALLLRRILRTNTGLLTTLPVLQKHESLPPSFAKASTLAQLAEAGSREPDAAWAAFQALWAELTMSVDTARHTPRPPVMLSLDGLAWASRPTSYLAPDMHYIHAHDLVLVKHFVDHLSGQAGLPNGGAVIAADSKSNRPHTPALDLAIKQSEQRAAALKNGEQLAEQPLVDPEQPWDRVDERGLLALRGVPTVRAGALSKGETRSLLEYYARSGMLRRRVTEGLVGEAWTLSGGGNVCELERASVGGGFM